MTKRTERKCRRKGERVRCSISLIFQKNAVGSHRVAFCFRFSVSMGSSAQKLLRFYPLHEDSESTSQVAETAAPRSSFVKVYLILLTSLTIFLLGLIVILVLVVISKRAPSVSSPPVAPSSVGPSSSSTTRGLTTNPISTSTRKVTTACK